MTPDFTLWQLVRSGSQYVMVPCVRIWPGMVEIAVYRPVADA